MAGRPWYVKFRVDKTERGWRALLADRMDQIKRYAYIRPQAARSRIGAERPRLARRPR